MKNLDSRTPRVLYNKIQTQGGGIAQLGERLNGIQEVSGSIPLTSTKRYQGVGRNRLAPFSLVFSLFAVVKRSFVWGRD